MKFSVTRIASVLILSILLVFQESLSPPKIAEGRERSPISKPTSRTQDFPQAGNASRQRDISRYRNGKLENRVDSTPKDLEKNAFADPDKNLKKLALYLTSGVDDPFMAVKNLHDWVATRISYDVDAFFSGARLDQKLHSVLSRRKAVCGGYTSLFRELCQESGISCVSISGYARGHDYNLFKTEMITEDHAWNAVRIGNAWYLIDVTWDSGFVEKRSFHKNYSTDYFLLPADKMIYTHYPLDDAWQFLDPFVSREQFLFLPNLRGRFFQYEIPNFTELKSRYSCESEMTVNLLHPAGVHIQAQMHDKHGIIERKAVFEQRSGKGTSIHIRPPRDGNWDLRFFASDGPERESDHIWSTMIMANNCNGQGFPARYEDYNLLGCELVSPLISPLLRGATYTLDLTAPGAEEALLVAGSNKILIYPIPDSRFRFVNKILVGSERKIEIFVRTKGEKSYKGILSYSTVSRIK